MMAKFSRAVDRIPLTEADKIIKTFKRVEIVQDAGQIDITNDEHILRNLDYTNPRLRVEFVLVENG